MDRHNWRRRPAQLWRDRFHTGGRRQGSRSKPEATERKQKKKRGNAHAGDRRRHGSFWAPILAGGVLVEHTGCCGHATEATEVPNAVPEATGLASSTRNCRCHEPIIYSGLRLKLRQLAVTANLNHGPIKAIARSWEAAHSPDPKEAEPRRAGAEANVGAVCSSWQKT